MTDRLPLITHDEFYRMLKPDGSIFNGTLNRKIAELWQRNRGSVEIHKKSELPVFEERKWMK